MNFLALLSTFPLPILFFLPMTTHATDKPTNPTLSSRLKLSTTNLDRHALLLNPSDYTFNFNLNLQPTTNNTNTPGSVTNANAATFPGLAGIGMTLAMINLGPCAMLPPHSHPRATNIVVAIKGNTSTWMVAENGAKTVEVNLTPGIMTIFERGSLHAMMNNGCEPAFLVSALDSEDSGTMNHLNGLFQLPHDIIKAGFGRQFSNFDVTGLGEKVPPVGTGAVLGSEECLKRCGVAKGL